MHVRLFSSGNTNTSKISPSRCTPVGYARGGGSFARIRQFCRKQDSAGVGGGSARRRRRRRDSIWGCLPVKGYISTLHRLNDHQLHQNSQNELIISKYRGVNSRFGRGCNFSLAYLSFCFQRSLSLPRKGHILYLTGISGRKDGDFRLLHTQVYTQVHTQDSSVCSVLLLFT